MTFSDAYNLPVFLRKWWIKRVTEVMNEEAEAHKKSNQLKK